MLRNNVSQPSDSDTQAMLITDLTISKNTTKDQAEANQEERQEEAPVREWYPEKNQSQFRDMHLFKNSVLSQEEQGTKTARSNTSSLRRMMTTEELE